MSNLRAAGLYLRDRRDAAGLKQEDVAKQIGVSTKSISKWENGHAMPDTELLIRLCAAINADLSEYSRRYLDAPADTREDPDVIFDRVFEEHFEQRLSEGDRKLAQSLLDGLRELARRARRS